MALPVIQYKRHRVAYIVVAAIGLLLAGQGCYLCAIDDGPSIAGGFFLIIGFIALGRGAWVAIKHAVVLELNGEGILYKRHLFSWDTLRSYAIRKEIYEDSSGDYLVLHFKDNSEPLEIQLDWMEHSDDIPAQLEAYAAAFKIAFDGVIQVEK